MPLASGRDVPDSRRYARREGAALRLPDALAGHFGVVLFYRGSVVSVLRRPAPGVPEGRRESAGRLMPGSLALSVDDVATTRELVASTTSVFPSGTSADADAVAEVDRPGPSTTTPGTCSSTGFELDPTGRVLAQRLHRADAIGWLSARRRGSWTTATCVISRLARQLESENHAISCPGHRDSVGKTAAAGSLANPSRSRRSHAAPSRDGPRPVSAGMDLDRLHGGDRTANPVTHRDATHPCTIRGRNVPVEEDDEELLNRARLLGEEQAFVTLKSRDISPPVCD